MKTPYLILLLLLFTFIAHAQTDSISVADTIKEQHLNEITVAARRPTIRTKGGKMTISVKNTVLSEMGSVKDMLLNTPGLVQGTSGVEVPGKGTPLFIVDDKEVTKISMLDILKSDNVESIEIDFLWQWASLSSENNISFYE